MSVTWKAEVVRLNPATDVLIVKVKGDLNQQQADDIRRRVAGVMPELRSLILADGIEVVVLRKTRRKTLVMAEKGRR